MKKFRLISSLLFMLTLLLILSIVCTVQASAETPPEDIYYYETVNGEATITGFKKDISGKLVFPDTLDGCPVTKLSFTLSYLPSKVTAVTIPRSVKVIDEYTFYGSNIEALSFSTGSQCETIGKYAFAYSEKLKSISIPSSVTTIDGAAFYKCSSLESVELSQGLESLGGNAFYNCSSLSSVTIPSSVTSIGLGAFNNCSNLTNIYVLGKDTSFGTDAFPGNDLTFYCHSASSADSYYQLYHLNRYTVQYFDSNIAVPVMVQSKTENSITLVAVDSYEYSMGNGLWQTNTEFVNLSRNSEYTFYQRPQNNINNLQSQGKTVATSDHEFTVKSDTMLSDANCENSAIYCYKCLNCGEISQERTFTVGEPLEHLWESSYQCDSEGHWRSCSRSGCYATEEKSSHEGGSATCEDPAICSICDAEYASALEHSYDQIVSDRYLWEKATCEQPAEYFYSCTRCGNQGAMTFKSGEPLSHFWGQSRYDDEGHWRLCINEGCDVAEKESDHSGGVATCTSKAHCDICNIEYGGYGPHSFSSAWEKDDYVHWRQCVCGQRSDEWSHYYSNGTHCDTCGYASATISDDFFFVDEEQIYVPDSGSDDIGTFSLAVAAISLVSIILTVFSIMILTIIIVFVIIFKKK